MFGYSLLRVNQNREFMKALMEEMAAFHVPIEGLAYRDRSRRV
jgi:glutamine synthetase